MLLTCRILSHTFDEPFFPLSIAEEEQYISIINFEFAVVGFETVSDSAILPGGIRTKKGFIRIYSCCRLLCLKQFLIPPSRLPVFVLKKAWLGSICIVGCRV